MRTLLLVLLLPLSALCSRSFTATTNTLIAATGASLPASGSVSLAFNPTFSQSDGVFHYLYETDVTGGYFRIIHYTDNNLYFQIVNASGSWAALVSTYTMPTSTWATVTATWANGGALSLCFNGVFCSTSSSGGSLIWASSNTSWSIGNTTAGGNDIRSLVSLVGVWNRVLTTDEINALSLFYTPKTVASSGLLHDWDLTGSALTDSVGSTTLTNTGATAGSDQSPLYSLGGSGGVIKYASFY